MKSKGKILLALGLVSIAAAFWVWDQARVIPARNLNAYQQFLRAQGERLDIDQLIPPAVAGESNGLPLLQAAIGEFIPGTVAATYPPGIPRTVEPGKALVCWQQPYVWSRSRSNSWADLERQVETNHYAIELLHQAAAFPDMESLIDYTNTAFGGGAGQAAYSTGYPWLLRASAINHLHQGQPAAATEDICALLKLVQANRNVPTSYAQEQRWAAAQLALSTTWELLQFPKVADTDLARIAAGWRELDFLGSMEKTVEMRRNWDFHFYLAFKDSPALVTNLFALPAHLPLSAAGSFGLGQTIDDSLARAKTTVATYAWAVSWNYAAGQYGLQHAQGVVNALRNMQTNHGLLPIYNQLNSNDRALWDAEMPANRLWSGLGLASHRALALSTFGDTVYHDLNLCDCLAAETARRMVIAAIAIHRYQSRHERLPQNLGDLAPDFMPDVPLDPMDGRPFRYHPKEDGSFLLYSIGLDGIDDGGNPNESASRTQSLSLRPLFWPPANALDWVWPTPASREEVRDYYDRGLK